MQYHLRYVILFGGGIRSHAAIPLDEVREELVIRLIDAATIDRRHEIAVRRRQDAFLGVIMLRFVQFVAISLCEEAPVNGDVTC